MIIVVDIKVSETSTGSNWNESYSRTIIVLYEEK